ncbi:hypothetical protein SISNIDRAFT_449355 [Sistotremastrum niveocremeum HHB9708]|uniref:RlpA-like protein double-psi beta-barrel domain-containing protein n=2 Tax=Sistotremastraceae TaxID=3402574 RepID=A0A164ZJK7_9AGAM|nr:hypothetical protein SISNIDRAFT_449355 [Sistotremastrum niveocremeum HHB9708]KZT42909.1 hypothetical protein SISSUDRAFT_1040774 [Sistotremastrum suecicum HHB10207 ss-3]
MLNQTRSLLCLAALVYSLSCLLQPVSGSLTRGSHHNLRRLSSNRSHDLESPEYVHSLGPRYSFSESDGWETFTARSMNISRPESASRGTSAEISKRSTNDNVISDAVKAVLKTLQAIGAKIGVTITWYTGHDLENPSCWSKSVWTPTDDSLICAVTLTGWTNKPKCFSFLELCNGPKKCIFVRVVDTCAGCAVGSKHVDLTLAAFTALASPDVGVLQVQMRAATEPTQWSEELWGPKA